MPYIIYSYRTGSWSKNQRGRTGNYFIQPLVNDEWIDPYKHEFDRRGPNHGDGDVHIGKVLCPGEANYWDDPQYYRGVPVYFDPLLERKYGTYNAKDSYTTRSLYRTEAGGALTRHYEYKFGKSIYFQNDPLPQLHLIELTYNAYNNQVTHTERVWWPDPSRRNICEKTTVQWTKEPYAPKSSSYAQRKELTWSDADRRVNSWDEHIRFFTDRSADLTRPAYYLPLVKYEIPEECWEHRYKENLLLDNFRLMEFDVRCAPVQDMGRALYNAVENIPELDMNNIANIMEALRVAKEIVLMILSVLHADGSKALKSSKSVRKIISELWLSYRYSWNTTVSDIRSATDYFDRLMGAIGHDAFTIRGYTEGPEWVARAATSIPMKYIIPPELNDLHDLLHMDDYWMRTYGVSLTAENLWDLVPFSFVVDWFLKIGDILGKLDVRLKALDLPLQQVWYSLTTSYTNALGFEEQHYVRLRGPQYRGLPKWDHTLSSSGKTWVFRLADVLSIFIGG